jgi:hypothetical protein
MYSLVSLGYCRDFKSITVGATYGVKFTHIYQSKITLLYLMYLSCYSHIDII